MFHIQMLQRQNKSKPSFLHPYVKLLANQLSWFVSEQTVQPVTPLGPLVGMKLKQMQLTRFHVYGTLSDPVHAVNMKDKINDIHKLHKNPFVIAVDACLGRVKSVGSFQIGDGPLKPGAGVQKDLPEVGDLHINGIVNVSGFMEYFVLQNTRLNLVMNMANVLAEGLSLTDRTEWRQERLNPLQRLTGRI
ncbi:putative sporulation protein YyaC [Bacillus subtilis]|nr:putative sporulation protein YyaC [Bacillus subtilis]